ncbi:Putative Spermidine synthase [Rhizopus microsporus]|uniref:Spermine synthase n=2 Tax=Rhizopus microsporus TaxID=58291 RepID=A0A2G4SNJ1_RHIZD|nr:spermine synthase [Rhizopus microsporus ATCC 52813]ORE09623.1 spermidine synthase [Rhizopus microsporus var. microsporus]PHZ10330.1 spermine synthase [Rhizopus microsporus ATCC 52813]CEG72067.1 Putative Spermidine synthase [Rhizopus microsporus]
MSAPISHPCIVDGWFMEKSTMWPGQAMSLKVEEILHHEKSQYQDVLVFQSSNYGNVLVLDNVIQATERDEFSYQEMITHLAMNSHPCPKKVLVIGGGDGGVLREVVKHECVEEAILVDIDEAVPRVSKKFLPNMAIGFDHPKVKVHIGDGFEFLKDKVNQYDVIITDSSDPDGPAESLFGPDFFQLLKNALTENGVFSTQGECMWLHLPLIKKVKDFCKNLYPQVEYAYTCIPTYPSGQIGHVICTKNPNANLKEPLRKFTPEQEDKLLRYYSADMHKAAFILPQFAKKALE